MNSKIILIAGGSGLIGRYLADHLSQAGFTIRLLTRTPHKGNPYAQYLWNPDFQTIEAGALDEVDGVIQLAGAGIADHRWTESYKAKLLHSRISSSTFLIQQINELKAPLPVYIQASAVGIYGNRPGEILHEKSKPGQTGFLVELCKQWEATTQSLKNASRINLIRIGLVLSRKGGLLQKTLFPAKMGLAPLFGLGEQIYPWIHIDDLKSIVEFLVLNETTRGVYNATAPNPISQKEYATTLCDTLGRPALKIKLPSWLLQRILGEMAGSLFESQHILPQNLLDQGFVFKYQTLKAAMANLLDVET